MSLLQHEGGWLRARRLASRVRAFGTHALCTALATLLVWLPLQAYAPVRARAQDIPQISERAVERASQAEVEASPIDRETLEAVEEAAAEPIRDAEAVEAAADSADAVTPIALPGGETRTAVNPQAISLPNAEGSIEGMGESFSPILSSGTATFGVPIAVAPGRAGVQPSISISYSSSGGNGPLGFGWGFGVPFISRQTDRGLPTYDDRTAWHPGEDRFIYNGGQELVPVDNAAIASVDGQPEAVPLDVTGWQQYRARVEGGFMRFFRAPDSRRWVVQSPDGSRFDFGVLPAASGASDLDSTGSIEIDDESSPSSSGAKIFRWMITRSADAHGSTIYYRYTRDQGQLYLADISYVSPVGCEASTVEARRDCTLPLGGYGARVRFVYEPRSDAFTTYTSGYPITTARRLRRVEVTAFDDTSGARALVRRYHFRYEDGPFHSLLASVQVEGRPSVARSMTVQDSVLAWQEGNRSILESSLTDAIVGDLLPAMRFTYSALPSGGADAIPGFGGLSTRVVDVPGSPPNSIDEARTELMDVNSDGLPDLVVTDPARYRTTDGQPAAGVFFNGFSGSDARPATAGTFSGAVPVPMRSDLSGVMAFSNLNIVPMDVDGDGRSDLLHMPRERTYGWFTPVRRADPAGGAAFTSPREQGWRFAYAELDLPRDDLDPRIDLTRDGQHIQVLDVNNDHLVDVVRTTGTVMQTWLNLGWLPGGDGRFGSYRITGSGRLTTSNVVLSTAPYESCVLQSGLPLDFESPEARFADMNGDGLQDIVEIQRGRIRYWPGRGLGSWGVGPRMCPRGEGANRYIEVSSPPRDLPIDLAGVQLTDIDGDGASDIVAVRFDAIDVWFNRAGQSFTDRLILRGTPPAPGFANRVRFTDIDGSGTIDAVYGDGSGWRFVDLHSNAGVSQRPRLLVGVENGLGAATEITYESAAVDYLRDLAEARSCGTSCESFTWSRIEGSPSARLARLSDDPDDNLFRAEGTPVLSTVVRSVRTTDRMNVFGREEQVSESHFAYHDGYYEGIEQEFRGFGAADAIVVGDTHDEPAGPYDESVLTRTWFHQGRRPANIADDRLAWSPDEALKGREYLTEVFDRNGTFLTTSHASLTTRLLHTGLDGRPIQYAFVSEMNEVRYDTSPFTPGMATLSLPSVRRETVGGGVPSSDPARTIALRGAMHARVRTTYDSVDNLGHVLQQTVYGHYGAPGWVGETDEPVTSVTEPLLLNDGGHWLWRTERQYGYGASVPSYRFGDTTTTFDDATGDPLTSTTLVSHAGVPSYEFAGDGFLEGNALSLTNTPQTLLSRTWFDAWGSSTAACAGATPSGDTAPTVPPEGCLRFGTVAYDGVYRQFPITETAFVSTTATLATSVPMDTANPGWDRGLGAVRRVRDPNDEETSLTHDGLGRLTTMTPPPVGLPGSAGGAAVECGRGIPTTVFAYELTTNPVSQPMSRVLTTQVLRVDGGRCAFDGLGTELPTSSAIGYVDGLGRVRATLAQAERPEHHWIRSGIAILDKKGQVTRAYHPSYLANVTDFATVLSPTSGAPMAPASMRTNYDAFGRTRFLYAEDGSLTTTAFHAASTTVCDPLDNIEGTHFTRTCTTSRSDGFGRVVDQILVESTEVGTADDRFDRLYSYYRADGVVLTLVRTQTLDQGVRPSSPAAVPGAYVRRDFVYDSVGRRLGSFDPDTDNPLDANTGTRTWRYRFNRVGDLVGVRDPRGCGQNFLYDLGGRLVGEQYVSCGEAQSASGDGPTETVSGAISETVLTGLTTVDVRYFYDDYPVWADDAELSGDIDIPTLGGIAGRATGVSDRGQRSIVAYDDRGNAIWTARQMAIMPAAPLITPYPTPSDYPIIVESPPGMASVAYDEAHTYVRTSDYDHAGRGRRLTLPLDPDFGGTPPVVSGALELDPRGLPIGATAFVGEEAIRVLASVDYDQYGQVETRSWGGATGTLDESFDYDIRNRPIRHRAERDATLGATPGIDIDAVTEVAHEEFGWDPGSNLIEVRDERPVGEWPIGHRTRNTYIAHDSLYRVAQVSYEYRGTGGYGTDPEMSSSWRADASAANANDPMHPRPAPMVGASPGNRIQELEYEWDWLGNQISWLDDAWEDAQRPRGQTFYERGLGGITNGRDVGGRPSALYLSTNIPSTGVESGWEGAGWVEASYGVSGNVTSFTVHGQCAAAPTCADPGGDLETRVTALRACACADEQHYSFRWDELNRLVDGRRHDRVGGMWSPAARMRYRYDGANQRTVKESFAEASVSLAERYTLYVYPGDFERRGLTIAFENDGPTYAATEGSGPDATETQYLIAGARIVWDAAPSITSPGIDRNRRATVNASDLLGTTAASLDLESGALLEVSTYYPNGARENLWTNEANAPLEPMGFTGKEADEEIGVTYFGERWLIPRLGRWATPDPLHVHASGGGEALNSYHYVSGNLLQAADALGLEAGDTVSLPAARGMAQHARDQGARESWTPLGRGAVEFDVGTIEARQGLNDAEWALAEIRDPDAGGTRQHLFFRREGTESWTEYNPCSFDRCGSAHSSSDNWFVLDVVLLGPGLIRGAIRFGGDAIIGRVLSAEARAAAQVGAERAAAEVAEHGAATTARTETRAATASAESTAPRQAARPRGRAPGCVSCSCFLAGTPVLMADGSLRAIEDIEVGDMVLADNPEDSDPPAPRRVIARLRSSTVTVVDVGMRAADGQLHFVHATREHPFWTNTGWVAAYELEPGDQLLTARGGWATLVATYERQVAATTFNLTVDGLPTFYVSLPDASVAVLVHNNGFGSGAGQHYADFRVESATGEARVVGNVVSGRMTAEEGALGFPRSSLATHTEARLTRVVALQPGETLIIEGGLRPCPSCRGAMRSVARSSQATVVYRWTEAGVQRTWTSVRGRAGRVTISRPTCP